jgi:hypothetical protein
MAVADTVAMLLDEWLPEAEPPKGSKRAPSR